MADFDIERFVSLSKAVDLSDIDWAEAKRVGVTDDEYRVLRFMADIEIHTIIYLRDVLAGHTAANAEVTQFMACWVYEETFHGRAIDRFLVEVGRPPEHDRYHTIESKYSFREELTGVLSRGAAFLTPHFSAVHMCWGAINELTAAASYLALARRTQNAPLAKLVTKLARDERKHYAFYFSQAEKRLEKWQARRLCEFAIGRFWEPVGIGVGEVGTLDLATSMLFGDEQGRAEFAAVDSAIQRLPGMEWFRMLSNYREKALVEFAREHPADFARHREADRAFQKKAVAA